MTTKKSNANLHHAYTPLTIRRLYLIFILPLLFIISACGGGGGGDGGGGGAGAGADGGGSRSVPRRCLRAQQWMMSVKQWMR